MAKRAYLLTWSFSADFVGFSKQRNRNPLKTLRSTKAILFTCSNENTPSWGVFIGANKGSNPGRKLKKATREGSNAYR